MHKVDRIVEAPAGIVWRILIDTREWPIWGPSVRAVVAPSHLIGPGMRGRIQTPVGLRLPFEITRREPEHAWSGRLPASRMPSRNLGVRPALTADDGDFDRCDVSYPPAEAPARGPP
ncbi:SRPBCC family protein [Thiocapsa roseopersicina]|uniref:Polyketide cyclase / dehydrase and lipid transport n=1 Tax=Thiocapsa roseopersicina TaxID=1058 RepID=A0A1H3BIT1_THIRO|nr:SRPBCC family protein [Thiocapsa roseopersicina]SDX41611.1 Polyketide cyclase / dehydrase and lipid transport [Thiocapsa roseopersicina]